MPDELVGCANCGELYDPAELDDAGLCEGCAEEEDEEDDYEEPDWSEE